MLEAGALIFADVDENSCEKVDERLGLKCLMDVVGRFERRKKGERNRLDIFFLKAYSEMRSRFTVKMEGTGTLLADDV